MPFDFSPQEFTLQLKRSVFPLSRFVNNKYKRFQNTNTSWLKSLSYYFLKAWPFRQSTGGTALLKSNILLHYCNEALLAGNPSEVNYRWHSLHFLCLALVRLARDTISWWENILAL